MKKPRVVIAILNWNGKRFLKPCISSLQKQTYKNIKIVVADNGSTDGSISHIKKNFNNVEVLDLGFNHGFAVGYNLAIDTILKKMKPEYIFLLNSDTVADKLLVERLVDAAQKTNSGIVGPMIYYMQPKNRIWSTGSTLNRIIGKARLRGRGEYDNGQYKAGYIDQVVGAAMLVRSDVFRKVGAFPAHYWAYYEETKFQFNSRKAGYNIYFEPSAILWHHVAGSSGGEGQNSPLSVYYLVRNRANFISEIVSLAFKPIAFLSWVAEVILRILIYSAKGKFKLARATIDGAVDFLAGVRGRSKKY
jgi:GT2 family glycosyltransferase